MHRRTRPAVNEFSYPAFCLRLPLSRLSSLERTGVRWNRPGLVSFHERDHGARDGSSLDAWIRGVLAREGVHAEGEIVLVRVPAHAGLRVHPVSFWVCHDASGDVRAVLADVHNTFGETHHYLLAHATGRALASGETLVARKTFHVSPFCAVQGHYEFRFLFGPGRWLARIDYHDTDREDDGALLETHISGIAEPLPQRTVALLFWRYRWFTLGVTLRIHWQAALLWARRVPFFASRSHRNPHLPATHDQPRYSVCCLAFAYACCRAFPPCAPAPRRSGPRGADRPDGVKHAFGPGGAPARNATVAPAILAFRDWGVATEALKGGDVAFAESYMLAAGHARPRAAAHRAGGQPVGPRARVLRGAGGRAPCCG